MKEFNALRAAALAKRNRLIAAAKSEYLDTLSWLSAVEKGFLGRIPSYPRKISKAVEESIPLDRPFTTNDIMATLHAVDTSRVWQLRSVNKCTWRMLRKPGPLMLHPGLASICMKSDKEMTARDLYDLYTLLPDEAKNELLSLIGRVSVAEAPFILAHLLI